MSRLLTDREMGQAILQALGQAYEDDEVSAESMEIDEARAICRGQLEAQDAKTRKAIGEWGDEECQGHAGYSWSMHRRQCTTCWESLK